MAKWPILWTGSIAVFIILGFLTPSAFAADAWCNTAKCDSNWQFRKLITIDYTKVGTDNNSGYITDFPFLVTFSGSDFTEVEANTLSNGADIRFTDQQGNDLEYEIEEYDETTNKMAIWVKSNSPGIAKHQNTLVYMYYGNSGASSTSNAGLVWDSNYAAVYHMNQTVFGADSTKDSTSKNNHGTPAAIPNPITSITGKIGKGIYFQGTSEISIPDTPSLDIAGTITLEGWVKTTFSSGYPMMINKGTVNSAYMLFGNQDVLQGAAEGVTFRLTSTGLQDAHSTTGINDGVWHHIVGTYDGTLMRIYVDGVQEGTTTPNNTDWVTHNNPLFLGSATGNFFMTGTMDELRLSNIDRSADFIKTQYNNQNSPSTFYLVGSEEISTGLLTFTADRTAVNTIVLTFSENVDTTTTDGSGYTLSTGTVSSNTDPAGSSNIMTLTTSGISGTSTTPTVTYTQAAGTTVDGDANEVENNFNTVATDSVTPTFTADRTDVNTIVLTFSESVSGASIANSFTVSGASSVTNTAPSNSPTVTLITMGLTAIDSSLLVTYVTATGNIADQASNEVANGENANTPYTAPPGAWCATAKCDTNWQFRKLITIDYTKVGTDNNSGYITDFPFLVTFSGSDFTEVEANTLSNGADIRFTDQQGNDLEYEIEEYDETTNKMAIWVKSNSPGIAKHQNTLVYMYYGNSGASSTSNAANVWDSNYAAVYHMNQLTFGASSTLDSTSNNNVGTPAGDPVTVSGMIGGAVDFDGNDEISITDAASLDIAGTITIQGWVKTLDTTFYPMLLSKGTVNSAYLLFVNQDAASKPLLRLVGVGDTQATTSVADGVWHHIVGTYDGTIERVYVDGVQENTNTVSGAILTHNNPLYLGSATGNYFMTGTLDEIRLSNTARSADFIKTEYNNQNSPSTFYSVGSEEGIPPPTLTITTNPTTPSSTKTSLVYTFQFSEDVTGFTSADITLNFAGAGAGAVAGSTFATTDANTYTLTLAGQDLTDLGTLTDSQTIVASVDMTGLTSISNTSGVGAEQNTWTYNTGPSKPPSLTANQGNAQIPLTWAAATGGVGSITDYIVEYKQSSSGTWLTFNDGVSTSTSATMTGLANDVSYDFRVSAESSGLLGSASSTVTIVPAVTATKAAQSFSTSGNILFDDVTVTATGSGSITVEKLNSNPEASAPSETIVGSFFDIASSGTISDRTVILSYSDADVTGVNESSLIIYRFSGGTWSALETIVDTDANTATATTPGFSSFVLGVPSTTTTGGGGCRDCTPPTLGVDKDNRRMVDDGLRYNDYVLDVDLYYTPFSKETVKVGQENLLELKIYENNGPQAIKHVGVSFGLSTGQSFHGGLAMIEWDRVFDEDPKITITDPEHQLDDVRVVEDENPVKCRDDSSSEQCMVLQIYHTFRESSDFGMFSTYIWDERRNGWQNYFNHGINIIGDSLNPPDQHTVFGRQGYLHTITETSKTSAVDENGDEWYLDDSFFWKKVHYVKKEIPTGVPMQGYDRNHPYFTVYKNGQVLLAEEVLRSITYTYSFDGLFPDYIPPSTSSISYGSILDDPGSQRILKHEEMRAFERMYNEYKASGLSSEFIYAERLPEFNFGAGLPGTSSEQMMVTALMIGSVGVGLYSTRKKQSYTILRT